jgi:hypothetical protein
MRDDIKTGHAMGRPAIVAVASLAQQVAHNSLGLIDIDRSSLLSFGLDTHRSWAACCFRMEMSWWLCA